MNYKNEKQLLLIIRYALPLFILIISISVTIFLYYENKADYKKIQMDIEKNFVDAKKQVIKEQIDNLYNYIVSEQESTEERLKDSLIKRVHEAHNIITSIYVEHKDEHPKKELTSLIKAAITPIRFNNNRGYFFVYDKKAVNVIHPLLPHLEGKSVINFKDTKGNFVLQDSLNLLKNQDESYQEWYWRKTKGDLKEYKKIGFVKNIYELDWFIGTGEYIEDFSKDIQKTVLSQIEKLKYGKNSYFIVTDRENNYISHINKELIGKNALAKLKEMNDLESVAKIENVINLKEGFVYIDFFKPNSNEVSSKIIYLRTIPQWGWVISTGFYKSDSDPIIDQEKLRVTNHYENTLSNLYIISTMSTILLLIISFLLSKLIEKKFNQYKVDIKHHEDENKRQYELLSQKSKLAAMGEMMENIAHQWRQPLSVISTASTGIKVHKEMDSLSDELLLESVDNITNSANHLSNTIEDFRDFFKPDKSKVEFDLKDAVEKSLNLLISQLKNNDIKVIKNLDSVKVQGYERELLQVLLNIINNARDAFKESKNEKVIFVDVYKETKHAIIKITDSAGGIEENIIKRVFEPYFTTKHKSQGTGIGLYMSQEIVTRHMNGKIIAENKLFTYQDKQVQGAVFTIELPI